LSDAVAGSAYDLADAAGVGLPMLPHDRIGMAMPPDATPPLWQHANPHPLQSLVRS
jgi:hypothetical protein